MTISTDDCRKFITDFQKSNPRIEQARFDGELDEEALAALVDPKNWKPQHKVRPASLTDEHEPMESYGVYRDGEDVNRYAEPQDRIDAAQIAWERRFDCQPFEGQVAYLILETHDGKLIFGEYVGD